MRTAPPSTLSPALPGDKDADRSGEMFDVEVFIEAVKERPALYNSFHKNYNRKDIRARLWEEIGRKMYPEWGSFDFRDKNEKVTFMQKKWKSLKDCFNREIRLQRNRDPKKIRKKYEFYDRLTFLLQNQLPAPTASSDVKVETPEPEIRPVVVKPPSNQNGTPTAESSRKRKLRHEEEPPLVKQKPQRKPDDSDDSDRLFLMSFVNDLKRLPFATKYWVRMMFSQIMHQAARSLDSAEDELEVGTPGEDYLDEFSVGSSPNLSSEIYHM